MVTLRAGQRHVMIPGYGVSMRSGRNTLAGGGNGLLNSLVAHWKLDEAAGANDALDAHSNGLTLTHSGSPGSNTGMIGTARTFNGSSQYFTRADSVLLSTGDVDFTISAWVNITALTGFGNGNVIASKFLTTGNQREYFLWYNVADSVPNNRFAFTVSSNGTVFTSVFATDFGAILAGSWYYVLGWHDAANNQIGIAVNDVATVAAYSAGVYDSTAAFVVAALNNGAVYRWPGLLDEISFWKSAAGGGGVLTAAQRTALYNGGAGLPYASFTV